MIDEKLKKGDQTAPNKLVDLLTEQIKADDQLKRAIEKENKTIDKCWKYIMSKAKEHLNSKSGYIEEDVILGWAIHYFIEEDEVLNIQPEVVKNQTNKPEVKKQVKPKKEKTIEKGISFELLELDLFGD